MSILITKQGFDTQNSVQSALKSDSRFCSSAHLTATLGKAITNIVAAPLHNIALATKEAFSLNGKASLIHLKKVVTSTISSALLAGILAISIVFTLIIGSKVLNIPFDGKHPLIDKKYEVALSQYKSKLEEKFGKLETLTNELKEFPQLYQSPASLLLKCLDCLTKSSEPRKRYKEFVENLDQIATSIRTNNLRNSSNKQTLRCIKIADELAIIRWGEVDMDKHFEERLKLAIGSHSKTPTTLANFTDNVTAINGEIKKAHRSTRKSWISLQIQKFRGTLGVEYFTGSKNLPNKIKDLTAGEHTFAHIRHGSPTVGKDWTLRNSSERIAPNYELFLNALQARNQGVFYVIHQRNTPNLLDDETGRTHAILALQNSHPNFHAMVQPVEGDFFKAQEGCNVSDLKKQMRKEFFERTNNPTCVLPKFLKKSQYDLEFETIFDQVYNTFFERKSNLSKEEREHFILFFYVFQRLDIQKKLSNSNEVYPISYYVTACKDNLDRGGGQSLLEHVIRLIQSKPDITQADLEPIVTQTLAPPILVKQKAMLDNRLNPILSAISLIANSESIQNKLRNLTQPPQPTESVATST